MILMSLETVHPGMVVAVGLRSQEGQTLLGAGVSLTPEYIDRLRQLGYSGLWIDDHDTRDILAEDDLSEGTRLAAARAVRDTFALTQREVVKLRATSVAELRAALESRRFQQAFLDNPVIDRLVAQVDQLVVEVLGRAVLTGLGSLRTHNALVYQHCLDVAVTATMIGRLLGYDEEFLKKLAVGCLLHDIRMIFLQGPGADGPFSVDEIAADRKSVV